MAQAEEVECVRKEGRMGQKCKIAQEIEPWNHRFAKRERGGVDDGVWCPLLSVIHRIPTGMNNCTSVGYVPTSKAGVQLISPRETEKKCTR